MSPNKGIARAGSLIQWLNETSTYTGTECRIWPFPPTTYGYGQVLNAGKNRKAHHVMMEILGRPRPAGSQVRHLCGRSLCLTPAHLRWGSAKENGEDKIRHGTNNPGEANPGAKITLVAAMLIRDAHADGISSRTLAAWFDLSKDAVLDIVNRRSWVDATWAAVLPSKLTPIPDASRI